jgi:hypothetical protein
MKTVFADAFYFFAVLSPRDQDHARATGDHHFEQAGFVALLK